MNLVKIASFPQQNSTTPYKSPVYSTIVFPHEDRATDNIQIHQELASA